MAVKGVFFDLYGTLIVDYTQSSWSNWEACFSQFGLAHGLVREASETAALIDKFWGQEPSSHPGMTPFESRITEFCRGMRYDMRPAQVSCLAARLCQAWQSRMTLDAEAMPLLEHLKGAHTMALISNFDHPPHVHAVLEQTGIAHYFAAVIVSGAVGVAKPDPAILDLALVETALEAASVVYVGDSIIDYEGARAAGMRSILVRRRGYREVNSEEYLNPKYREAGTVLTQLQEDGQLEIVDSLRGVQELLPEERRKGNGA